MDQAAYNMALLQASNEHYKMLLGIAGAILLVGVSGAGYLLDSWIKSIKNLTELTGNLKTIVAVLEKEFEISDKDCETTHKEIDQTMDSFETRLKNVEDGCRRRWRKKPEEACQTE